MGNVFPNARSAKLQILYGLNMSKIAALETFTIQTFHVYMYYTYGWWLFSRGGQPASKGVRVPPPLPP